MKHLNRACVDASDSDGCAKSPEVGFLDAGHFGWREDVRRELEGDTNYRFGEARAYHKQETFGDVFASNLFGVRFVECSGKESLSHSLNGAADRGDRHEAI